MDTFIEIATIASGFSTVVIALLTFFLLRENSLLRKSGSNPKLVAYFEPHQDGTGGLNIAIANVGTGAAQDVFIQFCGDQDTFNRYDLIMDCSSSIGPLTMIPQGEKISTLFAIGYQLFKPKGSQSKEPLPAFKIKLDWTTLDGKCKHSSEYVLDVAPYARLPDFVKKPYLLKISESIDGVSKNLSKLNKDVTALANVIETSTLEDARVKKHKGNIETSNTSE